MATQNAQHRLEELRAQREHLLQWGEDNLHPFVLQKKLAEVDAEIKATEDDLYHWQLAYDELVAAEAADMHDDEDEQDNSFSREFDELSRIPGVNDADD